MAVLCSAADYLRLREFKGGRAVSAPPFSMFCWFKKNVAGDAYPLAATNKVDTKQGYLFRRKGFFPGIDLDFLGAFEQAPVLTIDGSGFSELVPALGVSHTTSFHQLWGTTAERAATNLGTWHTINSIDELWIGSSPVQNFVGWIEHVAVWDTDLTLSDFQLLHRRVSPEDVRPNHLLAYLPLVDDFIDVISGVAAEIVGAGPVFAPERHVPVNRRPAYDSHIPYLALDPHV